MSSIANNVTLASVDDENTGAHNNDVYIRDKDYRGAMLFVVMTLCVYSLGIIAFVAGHIYQRSESKIQDMQISDYLSSVYTRKLDRVVRLERIKATASKCHMLLKGSKVYQQKEFSEPQGGLTLEPQGGLTSEQQGGFIKPQGDLTPESQGGLTSEPQGGLTPEPQFALTSEPQGGLTPEPHDNTPESKDVMASEPQGVTLELQCTTPEVNI